MRKVILQEFVTPLFRDMGAGIDLKLLEAKALDLGAVSLKYIRRTEAIVDAWEV